MGGVAAAISGIIGTIILNDTGDNNPYSAFNNGTSVPRTSYPVPELGVARSDVYGDVNTDKLNDIMSRSEYARNKQQYDQIGVAFSLARGYTGAGATIAVLDTDDKYWHGRVVADMISSVIAPNANIEMHQIAINDTNFFTYSQIGDIIRNASNGANILNNSWNVSLSADKITSREQIAALTDANFINAISDAAANGRIFVWAAGNNGAAQSGALSALPSVMPELDGLFINVVAWDSERGTLADYSNACGITKDWCITAPGSDLESGGLTVEGTSFAAPMVSAAISVLMQAFPYLSPKQITELLFSTATDLGAPGVDEIYGHGMIDLERATQPVGPSSISVADGGVRALKTAHIDGAIAQRIKNADIQFAYFDAFGRPYMTNLSDNVNIRNRSMGLRRMQNAYRPVIQIGNLEMGIAGDDFLTGDGFLQTNGKSITSFIATEKSFNVGDTELFTRIQFGASKPTPAPESIITEFSGMYTTGLTLGARRGDWMFSISAPDTIISGDMTLHMAYGRAADGTILYNDYRISLATIPAMEYAIGYKGMTIGFVDNPFGKDEFYMIATHKFHF